MRDFPRIVREKSRKILQRSVASLLMLTNTSQASAKADQRCRHKIEIDLIMTRIFDYDGRNLNQGFVNIRAAAHWSERQMHDFVEGLWEVYEPYADPGFREGFARDPDARFWEMYLGCALLDAGRALLPATDRARVGGQPDLCVLDGDRRIWIEAIAPDEGQEGPDQIVRPVPLNEGGGWIAAPTRQAQLRMTSAFWTKVRVIRRYVEQGVIGEQDTRIIAISASRFGAYVSDDPPLILSSLFPLGEHYVTVDRNTGEIVEEGFHRADEIQRDGRPIPRTAFLDPQFSDISGVIWSRISLGNSGRRNRPLMYVHNPLAQFPLAERWGVWDREYVSTVEGDVWRATDVLSA